MSIRAAFKTRRREGHGPECCVGTDHTPGHATARPLRPWMRSLQGTHATAEQRIGIVGQLYSANACRYGSHDVCIVINSCQLAARRPSDRVFDDDAEKATTHIRSPIPTHFSFTIAVAGFNNTAELYLESNDDLGRGIFGEEPRANLVHYCNEHGRSKPKSDYLLLPPCTHTHTHRQGGDATSKVGSIFLLSFGVRAMVLTCCMCLCRDDGAL